MIRNFIKDDIFVVDLHFVWIQWSRWTNQLFYGLYSYITSLRSSSDTVKYDIYNLNNTGIKGKKYLTLYKLEKEL